MSQVSFVHIFLDVPFAWEKVGTLLDSTASSSNPLAHLQTLLIEHALKGARGAFSLEGGLLPSAFSTSRPVTWYLVTDDACAGNAQNLYQILKTLGPNISVEAPVTEDEQKLPMALIEHEAFDAHVEEGEPPSHLIIIISKINGRDCSSDAEEALADMREDGFRITMIDTNRVLGRLTRNAASSSSSSSSSTSTSTSKASKSSKASKASDPTAPQQPHTAPLSTQTPVHHSQPQSNPSTPLQQPQPQPIHTTASPSIHPAQQQYFSQPFPTSSAPPPLSFVQPPLAPQWFYIDQAGQTQGPFSTDQMRQWRPHFPPNLTLRRTDMGSFVTLSQLVRENPIDPFMPKPSHLIQPHVGGPMSFPPHQFYEGQFARHSSEAINTEASDTADTDDAHFYTALAEHGLHGQGLDAAFEDIPISKIAEASKGYASSATSTTLHQSSHESPTPMLTAASPQKKKKKKKKRASKSSESADDNVPGTEESSFEPEGPPRHHHSKPHAAVEEDADDDDHDDASSGDLRDIESSDIDAHRHHAGDSFFRRSHNHDAEDDDQAYETASSYATQTHHTRPYAKKIFAKPIPGARSMAVSYDVPKEFQSQAFMMRTTGGAVVLRDYLREMLSEAPNCRFPTLNSHFVTLGGSEKQTYLEASFDNVQGHEEPDLEVATLEHIKHFLKERIVKDFFICPCQKSASPYDFKDPIVRVCQPRGVFVHIMPAFDQNMVVLFVYPQKGSAKYPTIDLVRSELETTFDFPVHRIEDKVYDAPKGSFAFTASVNLAAKGTPGYVRVNRLVEYYGEGTLKSARLGKVVFRHILGKKYHQRAQKTIPPFIEPENAMILRPMYYAKHADEYNVLMDRPSGELWRTIEQLSYAEAKIDIDLRQMHLIRVMWKLDLHKHLTEHERKLKLAGETKGIFYNVSDLVLERRKNADDGACWVITGHYNDVCEAKKILESYSKQFVVEFTDPILSRKVIVLSEYLKQRVIAAHIAGDEDHIKLKKFPDQVNRLGVIYDHPDYAEKVRKLIDALNLHGSDYAETVASDALVLPFKEQMQGKYPAVLVAKVGTSMYLCGPKSDIAKAVEWLDSQELANTKVTCKVLPILALWHVYAFAQLPRFGGPLHEFVVTQLQDESATGLVDPVVPDVAVKEQTGALLSFTTSQRQASKVQALIEAHLLGLEKALLTRVVEIPFKELVEEVFEASSHQEPKRVTCVPLAIARDLFSAADLADGVEATTFLENSDGQRVVWRAAHIDTHSHGQALAQIKCTYLIHPTTYPNFLPLSSSSVMVDEHAHLGDRTTSQRLAKALLDAGGTTLLRTSERAVASKKGLLKEGKPRFTAPGGFVHVNGLLHVLTPTAMTGESPKKLTRQIADAINECKLRAKKDLSEQVRAQGIHIYFPICGHPDFTRAAFEAFKKGCVEVGPSECFISTVTFFSLRKPEAVETIKRLRRVTKKQRAAILAYQRSKIPASPPATTHTGEKPSQEAEVHWLWHNGHTFTRYSEKESRILEKSFQAGQQKIPLTIRDSASHNVPSSSVHPQYIITMDSPKNDQVCMGSQRNTSSNFERQVMRHCQVRSKAPQPAQPYGHAARSTFETSDFPSLRPSLSKATAAKTPSWIAESKGRNSDFDIDDDEDDNDDYDAAVAENGAEVLGLGVTRRRLQSKSSEPLGFLAMEGKMGLAHSSLEASEQWRTICARTQASLESSAAVSQSIERAGITDPFERAAVKFYVDPPVTSGVLLSGENDDVNAEELSIKKRVDEECPVLSIKCDAADKEGFLQYPPLLEVLSEHQATAVDTPPSPSSPVEEGEEKAEGRAQGHIFFRCSRGDSEAFRRKLLMVLVEYHKKASSDTISVPSYWVYQDDPSVATTIPVNEGTPAYTEVAAAMARNGFRCKILEVLRIENADVWHRYEAAKQRIRKRDDSDVPPAEKLLFHGSRNTDPGVIIKSGFDEHFAKKGFYGKGIYFAESMSYSDTYAHNNDDEASVRTLHAFGFATMHQRNQRKQVFLARVLLGRTRRMKLGTGGDLTDPPEGYDSVSGRVGGGEEAVVVYRYDRSYPEYLISYET